MPTCFYCVIGTARAVTRGLPYAAGSGFGTCSRCRVHACPHHGDRVGSEFFCVDCIVHTATTTAVATSAQVLRHGPGGGPGSSQGAASFARSLLGFGAAGFLAYAPGISVGALRLPPVGDFAAQMEAALVELAENPDAWGRWIDMARALRPPDLIEDRRRGAAALGLFVDGDAEGGDSGWLTEADLDRFGQGFLNMLIMTRIRQLCDEAVAAFTRGRQGGPEESESAPPWPARPTLSALTDLALYALGAAYAARAGESLGQNPWWLPGFLRMLGPVFVLAIVFYATVASR